MLLVLIFALIIVSGLIAYLGDQIGMKIGKKRLSIFGIRPKYTSIIITVLTGILIAVTSITILMVASEGVRLAVFDMQMLVTKIGQLNREVQERDQRLREMANEIHATMDLLAGIRKQKNEYQNELDEKQKELDKKQAQYRKLEERLTLAQGDFENLARANMELEKSRENLDQKIINLEAQKSELERQKHNLETDVITLKGDITELTKEVDTMTRRAEELTQKVVSSIMQTEDYKTTEVIFRKGEPIYIETMETVPGATRGEITEMIENFLVRANKVVQKRRVKIDEIQGRSIKIPETELFEFYQALLTPTKKKILVGVYADKNIWPNDFVSAHLLWNENFKVFDKDSVIVEKEINPAQDPLALVKEIEDLLKRVNERSTERGLLPDMSGGVGSVGVVDIYALIVDFYSTVQSLKEQPGKIKITVYATKDIWRHEPLSADNLKFRVSVGGL